MAGGERSTVQSHNSYEDFVLDAYTSLSYKRVMGERQMAGVSWTTPGWVGVKHNRRLMAYKIRHGYYENAGRHFLPTSDAKERSNHREYGDAALIVETVKSALLGGEQEIKVPGADSFHGDDEESNPADPDDEAPDDEARRAASLQDDLQTWAEKERLRLKMFEVERNAVKLGDGVYVLGWSGDKQRPTLQVYDPGYFFPVLDTRGDEDFAHRVHIAWEIDTTDDETVGEGQKKIRRITWELLPFPGVGDAEPVPTDDQGPRPAPTPRAHPWTDGNATHWCAISDGVWTIGPDVHDVDNFAGAKVEWMLDDEGQVINRKDIGIDFIPILHVPNTVALEVNFGSSVIDKVLQILDDLASADTDLHSGSTLAGMPPIAVGKARLETDSSDPEGRRVLTYGPGTAFEVGDGTLTALDMSGSLTALIDYVNHLLSRLEVNARVPAGILGRIKPSEVPSGVALALSFGPMSAMIQEMRLVREDKYRLLLRFVTRFLWANGKLTMEPPDAEAEMVFGPYLPVDKAAVVQTVTQLLAAKAISTPTALTMLIEAGFPIEDAAKELAAIQRENFDAALTLLDVTDNIAVVEEYLGLPSGTINVPPPPEPVIDSGDVPPPEPPAPGPLDLT